MNAYKLKRNTYKTLCYIFLVILFLISFLPVYLLFVNATRSTAQINAGFSLIPGTSLMENWQIVDGFGLDIPLGLRNSLVIAASSTFLTVYFSLLTAYAINVYNFKYKRFFYGFILAMNLVPMNLYLIGFFQYMHMLGMLNTLPPMIIPAIAAPGAVFFFKQYLDAALVPDLIQAARIDGTSEFGIFNKIVLPLAAPGAFTMAIFSFVGSWNAFMGPLFIIGGNTNLHTLPLIMQRLQGDAFRVDWGAIYLGMAISLAPVIVIYAIFSRYIVSGITLGSVKE
ncbi:MAG: carbohydrate ABC transporter permease [Defluviitaleaceae bacterium]|nr:carbohydrate ABC transporter permease [Defluviitaleaceae bacterium]